MDNLGYEPNSDCEEELEDEEWEENNMASILLNPYR